MEDNTIAGNKEGKSVENQSRMPKRAEEIQICGNNKEKRKQKRQKQEKNYCKVYYAGCKLSSENKSTLKQQSAGNKVRQKIKRKQKGNDYDRTVE